MRKQILYISIVALLAFQPTRALTAPDPTATIQKTLTNFQKVKRFTFKTTHTARRQIGSDYTLSKLVVEGKNDNVRTSDANYYMKFIQTTSYSVSGTVKAGRDFSGEAIKYKNDYYTKTPDSLSNIFYPEIKGKWSKESSHTGTIFMLLYTMLGPDSKATSIVQETNYFQKNLSNPNKIKIKQLPDLDGGYRYELTLDPADIIKTMEPNMKMTPDILSGIKASEELVINKKTFAIKRMIGTISLDSPSGTIRSKTDWRINDFNSSKAIVTPPKGAVDLDKLINADSVPKPKPQLLSKKASAVCAAVDSSVFKSTQNLTTKSEISFASGKYIVWNHEKNGKPTYDSGMYTCTDTGIKAKFFEKNIDAKYDPKTKILTWDNIKYSKAAK